MTSTLILNVVLAAITLVGILSLAVWAIATADGDRRSMVSRAPRRRVHVDRGRAEHPARTHAEVWQRS
jgi:hypothetical protein